MPSEFALSLARYLEVFRHAPMELSSFLEQQFDSYSIETLTEIDRISLDSAAAKILERDDLSDRTLADVRFRFPEFNRIEDEPLDFEELARKCPPEFLEDWAKRFGLLGVDEAVAHFADTLRYKEAAWVPESDFHNYFGRQFAARVDGLVERTRGLEDLEYGDILSQTQRRLLKQAHHCYLHGLDESVAVLCGALIEEILKKKLKLDWKLEQLLQEGEERGLLAPEEWGMGDFVRELRNDALHNPSKFARRPAHEIAVILTNTRTVLKRLLLPQIE